MLTVDQIKQVFSTFQIKGFQCEIDGIFTRIRHYQGHEFLFIREERVKGDALFYDSFLQKVIEGINKKHTYMAIVTFYDGEKWWCFDAGEDKYNLPSTSFDTPEQAKEEAIIYILEQLKEIR